MRAQRVIVKIFIQSYRHFYIHFVMISNRAYYLGSTRYYSYSTTA